MSEKRFVCIDVGYGDDWYITDNGERLSEMEIVDCLNEQQDEIQQLKEKLQISEGSLALLIDIILFGDVDELVKRAREAAEQFDKFTKEELEEMITGGVSNE